MRVQIILLSLLSLFSCRDNSDLELQIVTKSVESFSGIKERDIASLVEDKEYDRLSLNEITYTIKNNSNKKYILFFNKKNFNSVERHYYDNKTAMELDANKNDMTFSIYNNNNAIQGYYYSLGHIFEAKSPFYTFTDWKMRSDSIYQENITRSGEIKSNASILKLKHFYENAVIIYPGQERYFTTVVNLPLRSPYDDLHWLSKIEHSKNYTAKLILINNASEALKYISENQKAEIEKNDYIIFDDTLISNEIPVKLKPYQR